MAPDLLSQLLEQLVLIREARAGGRGHVQVSGRRPEGGGGDERGGLGSAHGGTNSSWVLELSLVGALAARFFSVLLNSVRSCPTGSASLVPVSAGARTRLDLQGCAP